VPINWSKPAATTAPSSPPSGARRWVQLNRIPAAAGVKAKILVKVEYFSPSEA